MPLRTLVTQSCHAGNNLMSVYGWPGCSAARFAAAPDTGHAGYGLLGALLAGVRLGDRRRRPMTLPYRQGRFLRRADRAHCRSDLDLASTLSIFARLAAAERMSASENREPGDAGGL